MSQGKTADQSGAVPVSGLQKIWSDYSESPLAVTALIIFVAILFIAIFAPLVSPTNPYDLATVDIMNSRLPPGSEDFSGNYYLLGTDGAGRDMVSALFYGLRISLGVGVLSGIFALIIGSLSIFISNIVALDQINILTLLLAFKKGLVFRRIL